MFCPTSVTKVPKLLFVAMVTTMLIQPASSYYDMYDSGFGNNVFNRCPIAGANRTCEGVHVEIIVSPMIENTHHDYLVLYWETLRKVPGDKVVLYNQDPNLNRNTYLFSAPVNSMQGWVRTNTIDGRNSIIPINYEKNCLGYWVAYICGNSGSIIASSCLSTEPRWMEESWSAISRLSLKNIFIPGTHNSAAYKGYVAQRDDNIFYKYTYCQEISVLGQLLWGVRALDLRISYYPKTKDRWWCNHDFVRIRPLKEVIEDIKLFLRNTKEIIILDVHRFPIGFANHPATVHKRLLSYLEKELGHYLAPSSLGWSATLGDVKRSGKRVILAYNSYYGLSDYKWRPVKQKWPNKQTLSELEQYLGTLFDGSITGPWAVMAELTAQITDVLFDRLGGLRRMAYDVNPTITTHFNGPWGITCNIVHCDYIRGTGIVKAAIKWNLKRAGCEDCTDMVET